MAASEAQLGKATYNGMIFEVATKKDTKKHGIHGMFLTIPSHKKSPSSETTMAISGCALGITCQGLASGARTQSEICHVSGKPKWSSYVMFIV